MDWTQAITYKALLLFNIIGNLLDENRMTIKAYKTTF